MQPLREVNVWQLFHTYAFLERNDRAAALRCPDDNSQVITRLNPQELESLYLWCPQCNSWTKPGIDLIRQVEAVVKEHYNVSVVL